MEEEDREYMFRGKHVVSDITNIPSKFFDNEHELLLKVITDSLKHINATIMDIKKIVFPNGGVSVVWVLAESHASIHSYPEINSLFFDSFTCGEIADPEKQLIYLLDKIGCQDRTTILYRGEH
jgi:S-adenosylmethionine decarboxylase proenzyme